MIERLVGRKLRTVVGGDDAVFINVVATAKEQRAQVKNGFTEDDAWLQGGNP